MSQGRTIDDVIDRTVRELDLEAKITLLTGAAAFSLHGNDAIGLRPMIFSDGPTGVRGSEFVGGKIVALFPNATLLAQALHERMGYDCRGRPSEGISDQCVAFGLFHLFIGAGS
jgi:beta-glucosidase